MKITESKIRRIIREEIKLLKEKTREDINFPRFTLNRVTVDGKDVYLVSDFYLNYRIFDIYDNLSLEPANHCYYGAANMMDDRLRTWVEALGTYGGKPDPYTGTMSSKRYDDYSCDGILLVDLGGLGAYYAPGLSYNESPVVVYEHDWDSWSQTFENYITDPYEGFANWADVPADDGSYEKARKSGDLKADVIRHNLHLMDRLRQMAGFVDVRVRMGEGSRRTIVIVRKNLVKDFPLGSNPALKIRDAWIEQESVETESEVVVKPEEETYPSVEDMIDLEDPPIRDVEGEPAQGLAWCDQFPDHETCKD